MIDPPSTAWFYYYADDGKTIVPIEEQDIYKNDLIGLKELDERGTL